MESHMIAKHEMDGYVDCLEGIRRKTLVYGNATLMTEFRLSQGSTLPQHAHPYEQTGYLVSGHITLSIDSGCCDILPGGSWCIPANTLHGATIVSDSVAIEVFSPVREDYLP
jgi:quercetin dioxygenase-like cupin family protein